jgi:hypothetical protein
MGQAGIAAVQAAAIPEADGFGLFDRAFSFFVGVDRLHGFPPEKLVCWCCGRPQYKKGIPHEDGTPFAISSSVLFSKQVFWLSAQPG